MPDTCRVTATGSAADLHFYLRSAREALLWKLDGLPERERLVLSLYYEQELNLREIGAVLGVSESRACQIHGQAAVRLRARLADWRRDGGDDEDDYLP